MTGLWSLSREDLLEEEMETPSSVLAWRIPWTEELARLRSFGSHRVGHDWSNFVIVQSPSRVLTLCYPVDCSTPGFSVLHHLPELAQTHVHWISDAIQPAGPLLSPSPPAFSLSQHQGLWKRLSTCHKIQNTGLGTFWMFKNYYEHGPWLNSMVTYFHIHSFTVYL